MSFRRQQWIEQAKSNADAIELEEHIQKAAMQLQNVDHDIKAIVLFGSCVYAPDLAQDIDLLVITAQKKDPAAYWNALSDMPMWIDVVIKEVGVPLGDGLKLSVKVFGKLIWGEERYVEEVLREMPVPDYDNARIRLRNADRYMDDALQTSDERERQGYYRDAFNCLFDAARLAAMAFLKTEQTRWGKLRRILPSPFDERFRQIVNRLHVDYFYESSYPGDRVEEEYQLWCEEVKRFIDDLEKLAKVPNLNA